jgi:hypothetical protein
LDAPLKTEPGKRDVILAPAIAKLLCERWLASAFKAPHQLVFCNTLGRGLDYRNVGEDFRATVKLAAIKTAGERLSLHPLRTSTLPEAGTVTVTEGPAVARST